MKKDMMSYSEAVRSVKVMGRGLSPSHVVLFNIRLVEGYIKRREVGTKARSIRSEKKVERIPV